ncbi:MAG: hypothetical protein ABSB84_11605 [Verrucomicrobiota bacterium]
MTKTTNLNHFLGGAGWVGAGFGAAIKGLLAACSEPRICLSGTSGETAFITGEFGVDLLGVLI